MNSKWDPDYQRQCNINKECTAYVCGVNRVWFAPVSQSKGHSKHTGHLQEPGATPLYDRTKEGQVEKDEEEEVGAGVE